MSSSKVNTCTFHACMLSVTSFRTPFGRECEVAAKTEVDSRKAETPSNHWVFITRKVKDAAREHEIQKEQEFKDLLTRQQEAKPEEAPAAEETRPEEIGEELGDEY